MILRKVKNILFLLLICGLSVLALVPLFNVFFYVIEQGWSSLSFEFFMSLPAPVGEVGGGIGHAILGSLVLVCMASLMSIPLGLGMGILLSEYPEERVTQLLGTVIELLASVPSIVIGLFAYALVVKPFKGFSVHAGAVALSMIMIPMIARSTEEMLKLVHPSVREAGLALGLSKSKVILRIIVLGSLRPILVGVMLSVARIAGETAPLLFTAFASQQWFLGLSKPVASLPVQIYKYAISPYPDWNQKAWGGALILMLLVLTLNLGIRIIFAGVKTGVKTGVKK